MKKMPCKDSGSASRLKNVMKLDCRHCGSCVCRRGMKAILLADRAVKLYSTDFPPDENVCTINFVYHTQKCRCYIKDVACLKCGNVIGYVVVHPCRECLRSSNNGHLLMFYDDGVDSEDQLDDSGTKILTWSALEAARTADDESYTDDDDLYLEPVR